ncbi:MAG: methylenetetrahydrofolate reductase [NAD(P)H] [Butyrivibrio sp.]|uniref:methylenetetrahydrofolate reductase [NAD(P)H] n=1 Tax=Butyrivibrio sp. NC2002 TaxID=1410610 RepID=UPI00055A3744|nr:methylenetetrahydrofolate reductase [NAD(P)H] [Butyrivibrio sp. NC2002]MBE5859647.1 methylenetetrahydrofolate reductase [NAD(P)H] [Butyrivibrio sp.]
MGKIVDLYKNNKTVFSCEIYPPKKEEEFNNIHEKLTRLAEIGPDFVSVTYGAGGSNAGKAIDIADFAKNKAKLEVLSHITSVGFNKEKLLEGLKKFNEIGIENVLVLRGDRPKTMTDEEYNSRDFQHANEMAEFIRNNGLDFSIAGACYPHKHPEAVSEDDDIRNTKKKVTSGCEFLISQLFFDNDYFLRLQENLRKLDVNVPISAGIMPITSAKQLGTTVTLSGTTVPEKLSDLISKHGDNPEEMRKYGIEYAIRQSEDLIKRGVDGIHLYIMNKPELAREIFQALGH